MSSVQTYSTLTDAIGLAYFAHHNQVDKAGLAYFQHPNRVMIGVRDRGGSVHAQIAAILHDVTEDTAFTPNMLVGLGVPRESVAMIKLLDRGYSEEVLGLGWIDLMTDEEFNTPYETKLHQRVHREICNRFYYTEIAKHPEAKLIKEEDIKDNTLEWRLDQLTSQQRKSLTKKYAEAKRMLGVTE